MNQEPEKVAEVSAPMDLEPTNTTAPQPEAAAPEPQNEIKVFSAPVASTSTVETPTDEGESSKACEYTPPSLLRQQIRADKQPR